MVRQNDTDNVKTEDLETIRRHLLGAQRIIDNALLTRREEQLRQLQQRAAELRHKQNLAKPRE